jgi:hypothetical protein
MKLRPALIEKETGWDSEKDWTLWGSGKSWPCAEIRTPIPLPSIPRPVAVLSQIQVVTELAVESAVLWAVTPSHPVEFNRRSAHNIIFFQNCTGPL